MCYNIIHLSVYLHPLAFDQSLFHHGPIFHFVFTIVFCLYWVRRIQILTFFSEPPPLLLPSLSPSLSTPNWCYNFMYYLSLCLSRLQFPKRQGEIKIESKIINIAEFQGAREFCCHCQWVNHQFGIVAEFGNS